jgi:hypothetical protein
MSFTISSNDPTSRVDHTSDEPKKTEENAKKHQDFDFAGASYSAVHLPTGLIAAPSKTQIAQDLKDLGAAGKKVLEDLKSPALQKLMIGGGLLAVHTAELDADLLHLIEDGAEACAGDPIALAKTVKGALEVTGDVFEVALATKEFKEANTPEARAKLGELAHDLEALRKSVLKLHTDVNLFTATAPIRLAATGRI